jgi:hypothetical protein
MPECNICSTNDNLSHHPFMTGAFLCDDHLPKTVKADAPKAQATKAVIVDRDELMGLKAEGLVSIRTYVYLAMRIDGVSTDMRALNLVQFAFRWCIQREDCITAIAQLAKKGIVAMDVKQLMTAAYTHDERLQAMERSANG